jgi:hypothetical protein
VTQLRVLLGPTRFANTARGVTSIELSREEVCQALRDDIGISGELVDAWVGAGSLDASFEPLTGTTPAPVTGRPPSQQIWSFSPSDSQPVSVTARLPD